MPQLAMAALEMVQVINLFVFPIVGDVGFQDRFDEDFEQFLDGLLAALEENVEGALCLGIDEDDLEGRFADFLFQNVVVPLKSGLGVVFGIREEILKVVPVVVIGRAGMPAPFDRAKIPPQSVRE